MLDKNDISLEIIRVLKAQQWEKCKGELRAFIALDGAKYCVYEGNKVVPGKWEKIEQLTNDFVAFIESNSLHE